MDIFSRAAAETIDIEIIDPATGEAMIGDGGKPCSVTAHSPGSRPFQAAKTANGNRTLKRLRRKGVNADSTPEEDVAAIAAFLTAITISLNNFSYKPDQFPGGGADMYRALYSDLGLGWLTEQVNSGAGDWGNATKSSKVS